MGGKGWLVNWVLVGKLGKVVSYLCFDSGLDGKLASVFAN